MIKINIRITKFCNLIFLSIFVFLSPVCFAVDLLEVYQQALISDPQFRQIAANKRAVLEERPQALATLLPSVALSADVAGSSSKRTGSNSVGFGSDRELVDLSRSNSDSRGYTLSLTQPVFRSDRYFRLKQADKSIKQADAELSSAEVGLGIRVASTYFNVLAAIDNLNFAAAEKRSLSRQLEQAKQRFEVGLTAVTDVQEAQAGYDRAYADEIRAINEIDNAKEALREITGIYLHDLTGLSDTMPLVSPDPDDIEAWSKMAVIENLTVIAAVHAVDIARDEIKVQNAGHMPTVDLSARRSYSESDTAGDSENTNSSISLQLNVPIYSGGAVSSRVRASTERLEQQLERLEQIRRQVHREVRESYLGVMSGISQIKALQQAVHSSEVALEATQTGFEVGTRTAVDVVQSERATFQTKRDLARARYDYIVNSLNLKQAAGILSVDDIKDVNGWLN
ncbi:MAG: outer membrane protein [Gammaproteobacteria bacterium]|jgi:outer membrane protein